VGGGRQNFPYICEFYAHRGTKNNATLKGNVAKQDFLYATWIKLIKKRRIYTS
jgi:hypothetical protein